MRHMRMHTPCSRLWCEAIWGKFSCNSTFQVLAQRQQELKMIPQSHECPDKARKVQEVCPNKTLSKYSMELLCPLWCGQLQSLKVGTILQWSSKLWVYPHQLSLIALIHVNVQCIEQVKLLSCNPQAQMPSFYYHKCCQYLVIVPEVGRFANDHW